MGHSGIYPPEPARCTTHFRQPLERVTGHQPGDKSCGPAPLHANGVTHFSPGSAAFAAPPRVYGPVNMAGEPKMMSQSGGFRARNHPVVASTPPRAMPATIASSLRLFRSRTTRIPIAVSASTDDIVRGMPTQRAPRDAATLNISHAVGVKSRW